MVCPNIKWTESSRDGSGPPSPLTPKICHRNLQSFYLTCKVNNKVNAFSLHFQLSLLAGTLRAHNGKHERCSFCGIYDIYPLVTLIQVFFFLILRVIGGFWFLESKYTRWLMEHLQIWKWWSIVLKLNFFFIWYKKKCFALRNESEMQFSLSEMQLWCWIWTSYYFNGSFNFREVSVLN